MVLDQIVYFISQPLDNYNRERFGFDFWESKKWQPKVFELTALQHPKVAKLFRKQKGKRKTEKINYIEIKNYLQLLGHLKNFKKNRPVAVFDLMNDEISSNLIRFFLKVHSIKRAVLELALIPSEKNNFKLKKIKTLIQINGISNILRRIINFFAKQIIIPSIVFTCGKQSKYFKRKNQKIKIVEAHSFDYEKFYTEPYKKNRQNKILFIDENIYDHQDYLYAGEKPPDGKKDYFKKIKILFEKLEKNFKLKVCVAEHPKSRYTNKQRIDFFGNRECKKGKISTLIANSKVTLTHCSTAVSFAVLHEKPIILLTTDNLEKSAYKDIIKKFAFILKAPLLNIDKIHQENKAFKIPKVNKNAYHQYKRNYISCKPPHETKSLWEIIYQNIKIK